MSNKDACDGGCRDEGPEETCSLHGRPVAEVWETLGRTLGLLKDRSDAIRSVLALIPTMNPELIEAGYMVSAADILEALEHES